MMKKSENQFRQLGISGAEAARAGEALRNLLIGIHSSRVLNPKNPNHYVTMCRGYAENTFMDLDPSLSKDIIKQRITRDTVRPYFRMNISYRDASFGTLYAKVLNK